jgi:hypothetical protein
MICNLWPFHVETCWEFDVAWCYISTNELGARTELSKMEAY